MEHLLIFLIVGFTFLLVKGYAQPQVKDFTEIDFSSLRIAHRGGYAYGPENALKTILYSIEHGARCVEIDLQLTSDNQLVLFHDPTIERILQCDKPIAVANLSLAEIQAIPLRDTSQGLQFIVTLTDLLDTLAVHPSQHYRPTLLELDIKHRGKMAEQAIDVLMAQIYREVRRHGEIYFNRFFVSTFYPEVLKALYNKDQRINLGWAVNSNPPEQKFLGMMGVIFAPYLCRKYKVKVIEPNMGLISKAYVERWQKRGLHINAYTANTVCEKEFVEQFPIAYTSNCPFGTCQPDASDWVASSKKWCSACEECREMN